MEGRLWLLVVLLVINSAISAYYYLRLILAMVEQPIQPAYGMPVSPPFGPAAGSRWTMMMSLGFVTTVLLWLGVYPDPLIGFIRDILGPLVGSVMTASS